jgi:hypothetical protein
MLLEGLLKRGSKLTQVIIFCYNILTCYSRDCDALAERLSSESQMLAFVRYRNIEVVP